MSEPLPIVLVPGLACTPILFEAQIAPLWRFGPVTVADHSRDDTMAAIARRVLAAAPPRFALVGLSMGGYISLEVMRQAPERVAKLALLDTSARPDAPEQIERRKNQIALAEGGRYREIWDILWPIYVHPARQANASLRGTFNRMMSDFGADAFVRQLKAIMSRPDSRPGLAAISCPTLVLVGDSDALTPPTLAQEMTQAIPGARLVTISDSGHLSTMEQPEAVTRALCEWLAG